MGGWFREPERQAGRCDRLARGLSLNTLPRLYRGFTGVWAAGGTPYCWWDRLAVSSLVLGFDRPFLLCGDAQPGKVLQRLLIGCVGRTKAAEGGRTTGRLAVAVAECSRSSSAVAGEQRATEGFCTRRAKESWKEGRLENVVYAGYAGSDQWRLIDAPWQRQPRASTQCSRGFIKLNTT